MRAQLCQVVVARLVRTGWMFLVIMLFVLSQWSIVYRHNNIRDILGHSAKAAGLAAVVTEKKNQVEGLRQ